MSDHVTSLRGKKMVLVTIARLGIENNADNRVAVLDLAREGSHPDSITAEMVATRIGFDRAGEDNFTIQFGSTVVPSVVS